ncbi:MAG: hypothetical protein ABW170_08625 [Candidatus Thiodiazotropha sp. L084R]
MNTNNISNSLWPSLKADAKANSINSESTIRVFASLLVHPGMQMLFLYRLEKKLRRYGALGKIFGRIIRVMSVILTSSHVSCDAYIEPGVAVPHASGIVIGEGVHIKKYVRIYQHVTIGKNQHSDSDYPVVGEGSTLYAGCCILGNIRIGNNVTIGANAVVLKSIPDGRIAVGVPARLLRKENE